jgi:dethiobiotin synthetase
VVSRATFGTINHTLMTHECLKVRGVPCAGFFINRFPSKPNLSESTGAEVIASISNLPLLGAMPELGELFSQAELVDTFARSLNQDAFEEAFYL